MRAPPVRKIAVTALVNFRPIRRYEDLYAKGSDWSPISVRVSLTTERSS